MRKRYKVMALIGVIVCTTGAFYHATVAYMTDEHKVVNTLDFVGENGLRGVLSEPSWEPRSGLLTVPGTIMQKDPQVTNTSETDMNGLVALKLEFVYTDSCSEDKKAGAVLTTEDMELVNQVFHIDYNSDLPGEGEWIRFAGEQATDSMQCFYYKKVLRRNYPGEGDTTAPLFTCVEVNEQANNQDITAIRELGGIGIRISGCMLQQMTGEINWGLNSAEEAYQAGLFADLVAQTGEV